MREFIEINGMKMKIYPQDFKRKAKSAKSTVHKALGIKVASTKMNDAIAQAYGWQHYHELNQSIKKECQHIHELDLDYYQYSSLVNDIFEKTISAAIEKLYDELSDKDREKLENDKDGLNEFLNLPNHTISSESINSISDSGFLRSYYGTLEAKRHEYVLRTAFELSSSDLRTHSFLFNEDERKRMLNILKIFKSKFFSEGRGIWFVTEKEYSVLESRLSCVIKKENHIKVDPRSANLSFDEYFSFSKNSPLMHLFFVYPDNYSSSKNQKILPPEHYIGLISNAMNHALNGIPDKKMVDVIPPRVSTFTTLYVNETITNIPKNYAIKVAQSRSLGVATIIGTNRFEDAKGRLGEEFFSILANCNIRSYDTSELTLVANIEQNLTLEHLHKQAPYSNNGSILSLCGKYVAVDHNANLEKTI